MIDENIRAQPPAREDGGDRPIEASWTDGVTHAYVNLSAALSAERQAWRQKLGLRIASVRYLDVEVPQAREKAQPVAWRSVWSDGTPYGEPHSWPPLDGASVYHGLMGRTIQPLYAAPPAPEDEKLRVLDVVGDYLIQQYGKSYGLHHPVDRKRILAALQQEGRDRG